MTLAIPTIPDYRIEDREERELALAVECKKKAIAALASAADARKVRGADTYGIEQALDLEQSTMAGYQLALDHRRRELRPGKGRK